MGPVITKEKLEGTQNFIIRDNNNIIAAMCLIDTMNVKQNIVTRRFIENKIPANVNEFVKLDFRHIKNAS